MGCLERPLRPLTLQACAGLMIVATQRQEPSGCIPATVCRLPQASADFQPNRPGDRQNARYGPQRGAGAALASVDAQVVVCRLGCRTAETGHLG